MTGEVTINSVIAHFRVITFRNGGSLMRFCSFRQEFRRWLIWSKLFWLMPAQVYNDILTFVFYLRGVGRLLLTVPYFSLYPNSLNLNTAPWYSGYTRHDFSFILGEFREQEWRHDQRHHKHSDSSSVRRCLPDTSLSPERIIFSGI